MDGAEPGGGVEESVFLSCDRATVRVNARLGLVDEEDLAGEVGRMVVVLKRRVEKCMSVMVVLAYPSGASRARARERRLRSAASGSSP